MRPDISFVCAVESGALEAQTVRLVESLRKFGGRYADAPLFAITPRSGPPLAPSTRALFTRCDVRHIRRNFPSRYPWFNYYNKPLALVAAEDHITTGSVCFLDSDLLVVREPALLELAAEEDFLAFPVEDKEMGTTGPGDPFEGLWRAACATLGLDLESLPWVTTAQTGHRIRLYFNSGIFVYRHGSGFPARFLDATTRLMDAHIGTAAKGYTEGFKEQASIMFASRLMGLRWRALPYAYNYPMSSLTHAQWYEREALQAATVVHYHDAMWPHFWDTFMRSMADTHPAVHEWLLALGPMQNIAPLPYRVLGKFLRKWRQRAGRRYTASCAPS